MQERIENYRGKPIDKMSREELILAITDLDVISKNRLKNTVDKAKKNYSAAATLFPKHPVFRKF